MINGMKIETGKPEVVFDLEVNKTIEQRIDELEDGYKEIRDLITRIPGIATVWLEDKKQGELKFQ